MSFGTQFSLALELSNVFPVRSAVELAAAQLLNFARDLRRSGSDIVVEEDLAAVFGRGRINPELEDSFKNAIKIQKFISLSHGSEIRLDSGPGPTLHRALRERRYLATVIQLSLLAWMQNREQLASMLTSCMQRRAENNVQDASNPGYEGVVATLAACSSQCNNFAWSFYVQQIEDRLRTSFPEYKFHNDYLGMSEGLLLGAMDYFYLVQSLPDQRKILISNQFGCVTLILWAHFVLGLSVAISKAKVPGDTITFGNSNDPQVIIIWEECRLGHADDSYSNSVGRRTKEKPNIRLLDQDMSVILRSIPEQEQEIELVSFGQDRHPLLGYGTVSLHRMFNSSTIIAEKHPVYEESAKLITAIAIHVSNRLDREFDRSRRGVEQLDNIPRYEIKTEMWRILAAGKIIFEGTKLDPAGVDLHVKYYDDSVLDESTLPKSFHNVLKMVTQRDLSFPQAKGLLDKLQYLARVVLLFGHVVNVETCGGMPIILHREFMEMRNQILKICRNPNARATIAHETIFYGLAQLMGDGLLYRTGTLGTFDNLREDSEIVFLCSEFGWSVFLDTVGDKDPAAVKPHLVHVAKGVPTNVKTNERRSFIVDGKINFTPDFPRVYRIPPAQTGLSIPRAVAQVTRRTEYWATGSSQFEMSLHFVVEPGPHSELHQFGFRPFKDWTYCRSMQMDIWETFLTPPCDHQPETCPKTPLKLGPEAVAILGWSNGGEGTQSGPYTQRIVIFLTRGDARVRWLAVRNAVSSSTFTGTGAPEPCDKREAMLRTLECCDECALVYVSSLPGKWTLIL